MKLLDKLAAALATEPNGEAAKKLRPHQNNIDKILKAKDVKLDLAPGTGKAKLAKSPDMDTKIKELSSDQTDAIMMDVPLFIRMLEFSREDAKGDFPLHEVTEKALELHKNGSKVLNMDNYEALVGKKNFKMAEKSSAFIKVLSAKKGSHLSARTKEKISKALQSRISKHEDRRYKHAILADNHFRRGRSLGKLAENHYERRLGTSHWNMSDAHSFIANHHEHMRDTLENHRRNLHIDGTPEKIKDLITSGHSKLSALKNRLAKTSAKHKLIKSKKPIKK